MSCSFEQDIYYLKNDTANSMKQCDAIFNNPPENNYWLAKTYLLVAQMQFDAADYFQSRSTLESIISGYTVDDDILPAANELLNKVNTSNAKVYNLKATYPEDNNEFYTCVKDKYNNKDQCVVCCVKSHLRALEYALDDNSPEYSIILEDDVTFLKEDFNDIVDELIIKMDNTDKLGMVHIGYVMHDSYYKFFNLEKSDKLNNYPELHLFNIISKYFPVNNNSTNSHIFKYLFSCGFELLMININLSSKEGFNEIVSFEIVNLGIS